jgi:predicted glycosyltransferase
VSDDNESTLRVSFFTHDTFGLGHVRRCSHLARRIATRVPDSAILLMTGSPFVAGLGRLPSNCDVVKIPTIARTGRPEARPPHLQLPLADVTAMRTGIVQETLRAYRPDLFVVDNFPLGSRGELRQVLDALRLTSTRTALGLRDILDEPGDVRRQWTRQGMYDVLERYFDRILVYGEREVFDVVEAYGLPPEIARKVRYSGYVTDVSVVSTGEGDPFKALGSLPRPRVVICVGGGGDGLPLLRASVEALRGAPELSALLVTGPLMAETDRATLRDSAAGIRGLVIRDFLPDLPRYLAAADAVVTMGGYNTVAEILALGCRAVIVPRNWRYGEQARGKAAGVEGEQVLRAQSLRAAGLLEVVDPEHLDGGSLRAAIHRALERPTDARASLGGGGLDRAVEELLDLARSDPC